MLNSPGQDSELLTSFENLGALSDEYGLVSIKPFRDWISSTWSKKIFKLRLCNAGEIIEIYDELNKLPSYSREAASKIEFVIRSIYKIENRMLAPEEEVQKYNEQYSTTLSRVQYLRSWIKNVEVVVINRMYSIYELLEAKQIRLLSDQVQCEITGKLYLKSNIPEGSVFIKNCIGEIISKEGLESDIFDKSLYGEDIINDNEVVSSEE